MSAETLSEAALTRIAIDLLLFQWHLVAGMLRLVTRSLRADLFRFYVATIHKRDEGIVASFICCHRLCISMCLGWGLGSYPPRLRRLLADGGAVGRSVLFGGMGPPECSENNEAGDQALT